MDIGRQRFQVVKRELVDQVACAEDVCNLAWDKKRLELLRQVGLAVRDVHVADDEHEHLQASPHFEKGKARLPFTTLKHHCVGQRRGSRIRTAP